MKMWKAILMLSYMMSLAACIGDDFVDDTVDPVLRITNSIDTLKVGTEFQFESIYLDNIGRASTADVNWSSSDPGIISISMSGLANALEEGKVIISAETIAADRTLSETFSLVAGKTTSSSSSSEKFGKIATTSSYVLQGDFILRELSDKSLELSISSSYKATTALPGLYIFLSNNPNSISDAYEIGAVEVFEGEHSYIIGDGVKLTDYSHLLYYCKPFNVKVGAGEIEG